MIRKVVEGQITDQVPATALQEHHNIEVVIDENAAGKLTREVAPWLVGPCEWTPKFTRKAVIWLCGVVGKPILKLTHSDYIENSLGELLEAKGPYDRSTSTSSTTCNIPLPVGRAASPTPTTRRGPFRRSPFPKRC